MKTLNGKKALRVIQDNVDENWAGENFEEMKEIQEGNSQSFDVQALVSDDESTVHDYRIFDPHQLYCKGKTNENGDPERTPTYVNSSGWTHWQLASPESIDLEE